MAQAPYTDQTVTAIRFWTPWLFSLRCTRDPAFKFAPGQFARIGVTRRADAAAGQAARAPEPAAATPTPPAADPIVWRAYSMVSTPDEAELEFYSVLVPEGEFSPALARLVPGDTLHVDCTAYGFLTADRFAGGRDLWLIATGTGLAPFLSILQTPGPWRDYARIVLVHSVRSGAELAYTELIDALPGRFAASGGAATAQLTYLPVITRGGAAPAGSGLLDARVTTLLADGRLEAAAGRTIEPGASRVMLCGNPDMIIATRALLKERGLSPARRAAPGQYAVENYW